MRSRALLWTVIFMLIAGACGGSVAGGAGAGGDKDGDGDGDPLPPPAPPPPPPPGTPGAVGLELVTAGLSFPLALTSPPGDPRLFVAEKGGLIRIIKAGALVPTPFLDLSVLVSRGGEQGLLGLAFHPAFASNGRFFVDYTDTDGNTRIVAYRVSSDPDRADAGSAQILLTIEQPYSNHNGGGLVFGPDGFLYIGMGDGGSGGDPHGNGQDRDDLLGSLLRIDVNGPSGYAIPPDNPFRDELGSRGELWDYGLRNPWRFSFDRATGDLYIADVGQNAREEVNVATAASGRGRGLNYGWSRMEGSVCFGGGSCDRTGLVIPVAEYGHDQGCSITGGHVYRGTRAPELVGHYLYADFCEGWVRSFRYSNGSATDAREWPALKPGGLVSSFGEDAAGEVYILESSGSVYRIVTR